jgi:hypothetical protein
MHRQLNRASRDYFVHRNISTDNSWNDSKESEQKIIEAIRINFNYCREHSALGITPAAKAGVKLELGDKIESLIRMAAPQRRQQQWLLLQLLMVQSQAKNVV